jgi:hypothetical protein
VVIERQPCCTLLGLQRHKVSSRAVYASVRVVQDFFLTFTMNFYPPPPVIKAKLFLKIPESLRCIGRETEWTGGFTRKFKHVFLEGPVADKEGNLFIVDVPYGRILRVDTRDVSVEVVAAWDGEPNGLALRQDGTIIIADYKQVSLWYATEYGASKS